MSEQIYQRRKDAATIEGPPCKNCKGTIRFVKKGRAFGKCVACSKVASKRLWKNPKRQAKTKKAKNTPKYRQQQRDYAVLRNKDPEIKLLIKEADLLKKYNITLERFNQMLSSQDGLCASCGTPLTPPNVDHDHRCCPGRSCGKCVRALLCKECNMSAGMLNDSSIRCHQLATYLESFGL